MRKPVFRVLIRLSVTLMIICGAARPCLAAEETEMPHKPRVLFLGSYNYEWESVPKHLAGVTDTLDNSVSIDYVFMDTKRLQYEAVKEVVYRDVLSRAENKPFDYVIAADDAALAFVLEYRDELFSGIPVVFEGINDVAFAREAAEDPLITGVIEVFPLAETIALASRLQPQATRVVGITDASVSGQGSEKQFIDCQQSFPGLEFSIVNCSELDYDEIGQTVSAYGSDTILVYLMMTTDADGNAYSHSEAAEYVASCANVPVYKADELGLGGSILGGVMVSYHDMSAAAASIVLALTQGADIAAFPVETAASFCAFDKQVMDRFGITKAEVAAAYDGDVRYVNDEPSYFQAHKSVLVPAIIIVALLAAFSVFSAFVVSSKKKLVDQLMDREQMLNSLLDNIPGGLAVYRVRGTGQDAIETLYSSQGIPLLSGRTMEEYNDWIRGGLFDNTVVAEDLPRLKAVLAESIPQKKSFIVPYHLRGRDGKPVPVTLAAEWGHDDNDGSGIYYAVYMDNTEQEKAQNAEREAIEAKAANEAKSEFLSRMSHDIRTPLNAVLGFTELARGEAGIPASVAGYLGQIDVAGKYLLGLVNDVLDLSKIESGKLELHEESVRWQRVLDSAAKLFHAQAEEKGIRLVTDFAVDETPWIMMDELRMRQICMNLLGNAIKFSDGGTEIRWTVRSERTEHNTARVLCIVSDQGCGMSREFMAKMFQPFEQGDSSHSETGTGLGLPIVKSLVSKMGGTIHVESVLGRGSVFTIELEQKLGAPAAEKAEEPRAAIPSLSGLKVLLCEDNHINVLLTNKLLQKVGCAVDAAENGRLGVERFAGSQPGEYAAILMDIRMPVMDGLAATKAIRALDRPDAKTVPILSMSADAFADDVQRSLEAGMNAHLSKPIDPQKLYEALAKEITGGRNER